jgi:membrane protein
MAVAGCQHGVSRSMLTMRKRGGLPNRLLIFWLHRRWRLPRWLWRAYRLWDREDCVDLSAAFAYHTLQSLFPILLIALAVASRILGRVEGLMDNLLQIADQFLPESVLPLLSSTLLKLYGQGTGAGLVGAVFLLISATNAYLSLQRGADRLWGFRPCSQPPKNWLQPLHRFLAARLESFALVVLIGFCVVLDQLTTNLRLLSPGSWRRLLEQWLPASMRVWMPVPLLVDVGISLLIASSLAFALMAILPTRPVPRRALLPGACLIGCALTALNAALGRSLISLGTRFQAYGVISGVLVLSLWVWLVALILYYGIALSVVISRSGHGGRSTPVLASTAAVQA